MKGGVISNCCPQLKGLKRMFLKKNVVTGGSLHYNQFIVAVGETREFLTKSCVDDAKRICNRETPPILYNFSTSLIVEHPS